MSIGAGLFALAAVSAVSQITQGYAQKSENEFNATLYDNKAKLIDQQAQIESGQYDRLKARTMSTSVANIAGSGIQLQGSALAVILDAQTQINIDQAIGQFNFEQDKLYARSSAGAERRAGSAAVRSGYSGAFSTILRGAVNYSQYTSVGTLRDPTFDSVVRNNRVPRGISWGDT